MHKLKGAGMLDSKNVLADNLRYLQRGSLALEIILADLKA